MSKKILLEKIQKLEGVSFEWKENGKGKSLGFIAQDYEKEIQDEIISDTQLILREIYKTSKNNEIQVNSIERVLNEFINLRTIRFADFGPRPGSLEISFIKVSISEIFFIYFKVAT